MTQLDLFEEEFKVLQDQVNPFVGDRVFETVYEELDFLIKSLLHNHDDYFEFKKHENVTDLEYDIWLREYVFDAVAKAMSLSTNK